MFVVDPVDQLLDQVNGMKSDIITPSKKIIT
jgi:hypothetical protein